MKLSDLQEAIDLRKLYPNSLDVDRANYKSGKGFDPDRHPYHPELPDREERLATRLAKGVGNAVPAANERPHNGYVIRIGNNYWYDNGQPWQSYEAADVAAARARRNRPGSPVEILPNYTD